MQEDLHLKTDNALPLREVVFQTLRRAILMGELKPGEHLMEIHLAKQLGVSRTPVREALHKLEQEGLVTVNPGRGAQVARITEKEMKDVLELRRFLDILCVELACDRINDEQLDQLGKACDSFEEAVRTGDTDRIAGTDVALHDIIIQAAGNEKLVQLMNNLAEQMYRYRYEYIKDIADYNQLVEEHRIIYESIRNRDKETAAKASGTHIDNQEKAIMNLLRCQSKEDRNCK